MTKASHYACLVKPMYVYKKKKKEKKKKKRKKSHMAVNILPARSKGPIMLFGCPVCVTSCALLQVFANRGTKLLFKIYEH